MSTEQQELTGSLLPRYIRVRDHLSHEQPAKSPSDLSARTDKKEAWCERCGNRVTVGDSDEYGHDRSCPHSAWEGSDD